MLRNTKGLSSASGKTTFLQDVVRYRFLFLLTIPGLICYLVFSYAPMFGIDGASSLQRIWHITLPGIRSTIIILLILSIGSLMSSSFDKVFLLQTTQNLKVSEVISTYVYKRGILASGGGYPEFSYTTAIGLSQSLVNVTLLVIANGISRKFMETSLF